MTFDDFGLSPSILRAVSAAGYESPTPVQAEAIPHVMAGRDLLACAQTGTGKTAAFALPILHRLTHEGNPPKGRGRKIRVLVLSPTRELASQIADSFKTYGAHTALRHVVIYGGVGQNPQTRALQNGVDIVIATPGRLLDLMNQGFVDLNSVETLVLDEADRMFDMGFLPDLKRIIVKLPKARQTVLYSATMPDAISQLATAILRDPARVRIAPAKDTTDLIEQSVCHVAKQNKSKLLAKMITGRSIHRAIVFTRTKHGADKVTKQLRQSGIQAEAIHGNKSQSARQRALDGFKANRTRVLVATDVAARGIDIDAVSHVFNFDLPHEPETYVHRIGRTGRAGVNGVAVAFCDHDERKLLKAIERLIRRTINIEKNLPVDVAITAPPIADEPARHSPSSPPRRGGPHPSSGRQGQGGPRAKKFNQGGFKPKKKRREFARTLG